MRRAGRLIAGRSGGQGVPGVMPGGVNRSTVTADTLVDVMDMSVPWLVLVVRVPADPSRHRVAVWRELRRAGAVLLGQGVWAVPDAPVFADGIARTVARRAR
jgi:DNA-binding transcriptional regulator PaaX